jgi:glycosyltransferase involved in cell wall biosynthesis
VSGGVERVTLNLIAGFKRSGNDCALALRRARGELLTESHSMVEVHEVAPYTLCQFVPKLARLIRMWQPTHIVTAFADVAALTWAARRLARSHARWVHSAHNTHVAITMREGIWGGPRYRLDNCIAAFVYCRADAIVAVSEGVRAEVINRFRVASDRVATIYNPVVPDDQLCEVREPRHGPDQPFTIVALGRLTRQKGFDLLIDAMRDIPQPWQLDIWGDGEERRNLACRIAQHGLDQFIRLRGYTDKPYAVLRSADLFVMPSRWEGLPTVLVEALACQCQIIATDCPHGPREILRDGKLGKLVKVDDVGGLSIAIRHSISSGSFVDGSYLMQRAHEFTLRVATAKWQQLLEHT